MYCKNFLKHIVSDESTLLLIISKVYDMSSFKIQLSVCCLMSEFYLICSVWVGIVFEDGFPYTWGDVNKCTRKGKNLQSPSYYIYFFIYLWIFSVKNNNDNCESYKGMHDLRITSAWYKISFYSTCFWAYYDNKTL